MSVGKLGIITRLKFRLAHEVAVQRDLRELSPPQFLQVLRSAQDAYNTGGVLPTWLDEAEAFWVTQNYKVIGKRLGHNFTCGHQHRPLLVHGPPLCRLPSASESIPCRVGRPLHAHLVLFLLPTPAVSLGVV